MKKKITEEKLKEVLAESIEKVLNETTRRQKAVQAIKGISKNIKTCAILTAGNPMISGLPKEYNDRLNEKLKAYLKTGCFVWFPVKGNYGEPENSFIVYNISLEDAIHIGEKYEQDSIIWIDNRKEDISYQFWKQDGRGVFNKISEKNYIEDMTGADSFFTQIGKKFKFKIPFFEVFDRGNNEVLENHDKIIKWLVERHANQIGYDAEWIRKLKNQCLDDSKSGRCKYESRGCLYGEFPGDVNFINEEKKRIEEERKKEKRYYFSREVGCVAPRENVMERFYNISCNEYRPVLLKEVTLDRILKKHGANGFVCLSANRSDYDPEVNDENTKKLIADIKRSGYSYLPTYGGYRNKDNGVMDDFEPSFIVFNYDENGNPKDFRLLRSFALQMCGKYKQHSVMIKYPASSPTWEDRNGQKVNTRSSERYWKNDPSKEFFTSLQDKPEIEKKENEFVNKLTGKTKYPISKRFSYDIEESEVINEIYVNPLPINLLEERRRKGEVMIWRV